MIIKRRSQASAFAPRLDKPTIGEMLGGQYILDDLARRAGLDANGTLLDCRRGLAEALIQVCPVRNIPELVKVLEAKPVCYPSWLDVADYYHTGKVLSLTSENDFTAAKALYNTHTSCDFYVFQRRGKAYFVVLRASDPSFPYTIDFEAYFPPDFDT